MDNNNNNIIQKSPSDRGVKPTDDKTTSRWWWFIIQCSTDKKALEWTVPLKPKINFACWRPHKAPSTGQAHVHCLINFHTSISFAKLKNKGYRNLKYCSETHYQVNCREYCLSDTKTKNGTTLHKNPIGPYQQYGEFKVKQQGAREDLNVGKQRIFEKKRWREVLMDDDLTHLVAKYPKWAEEMYYNRPQIITPVVLTKGLQRYQKKALAMFNQKPVDRRLIWIYSDNSTTGKSKFYTYCCQHYKVLDGKSMEEREILRAYDQHEIIWFDLTRRSGRRTEKHENYIYELLEGFTNFGPRLSWKHHPVEKWVECHVVVTSNEDPPYDKIPDRIVAIHADDLEDLSHEPQPNPRDVIDVPPVIPAMFDRAVQREQYLRDVEAAQRILDERQGLDIGD